MSDRLGREAFKALANAMYCYTFGIVGDGHSGDEKEGLGTGVGVAWQGHNLILTAAHTLEATPPERLYFFPPMGALVLFDSPTEVDRKLVRFQKLHQLDNPDILLGSNGEDLAAVMVPEQLNGAGHHFYAINDAARSPAPETSAGFLGYPDCRKQPIGRNFSAGPYTDWGDVVHVPQPLNGACQLTVDYAPGRQQGFDKVDPHGLSGSGVWVQKAKPEGRALWVPEVELVGIVTEYWDQQQVLACYAMEAIISFFRQKETEGWLRP